jgi:hypothetical protein
MPAPSKNYTLIPDGSIDADSPLDVTLMTQIRDNLIHLEEWLGDGYTAAKDHDHDGVNSKKAVISKTIVSSGSQTLGTYTIWTPAVGIYNMVTSYGSSDATFFEIYVAGAWRRGQRLFGVDVFGFHCGSGMYFDGTNMRFYNSSSDTPVTIYWQLF